MAPRPSDSEGHGGRFYDTNVDKVLYSNKFSSSLPFERKVRSKKEMVKHIEIVTKKAKLPKEGITSQKRDRHIAKENAELLFNLIHGKERKVQRSKTLSCAASPTRVAV